MMDSKPAENSIRLNPEFMFAALHGVHTGSKRMDLGALKFDKL